MNTRLQNLAARTRTAATELEQAIIASHDEERASLLANLGPVQSLVGDIDMDDDLDSLWEHFHDDNDPHPNLHFWRFDSSYQGKTAEEWDESWQEMLNDFRNEPDDFEEEDEDELRSVFVDEEGPRPDGKWRVCVDRPIPVGSRKSYYDKVDSTCRLVPDEVALLLDEAIGL